MLILTSFPPVWKVTHTAAHNHSQPLTHSLIMDTGRIGRLPSGLGMCCSIPDMLFLPELVCGGLVWILVACTYIVPYNPQAYVVAVSVLCFIITFIWMMVFACGSHHNRPFWATADVAYHFMASVLYLSASVLLAFSTLYLTISDFHYKMNIAAVVMSYVTTVMYIIHTLFSAIRWKTF
ncbi:myelin and lymphocyte protein-like [Astyanax mexicanus]|uniref:Mal, T cell differentiation protein n=1 Tax=Astyanax mexicanus TaxID=7994 RepID=A0A8B9RBQ0_ASTMX|nr:myelin and lymphocyte protein-like [Astyanax mexicanus]